MNDIAKRKKAQKLGTRSIGDISPSKSSRESESIVRLTIKGIKYGKKKIDGAQVTTIQNGEKLSTDIPFEEPIKYTFKKIEDHMSFKFALTKDEDLLGFIYLEIPNKLKTMKEFKLDDWFPVKQVETDAFEDIKLNNLMAKVVIEYNSIRKFEINQVFKTNLPEKEVHEKNFLNLKEKLKLINEAVENYDNEGFKHLDNFQKKLNEKRSEMKKKERQKNKIKGGEKGPTQLSADKDHFYAEKLGQTRNVKKMGPAPTKVTQIENEYEEKLIRELTFTKKALLDANQKIDKLKKGTLTVDNDEYKGRLDKMKDSMMKERAELAVKAKEQNNILQHERNKIKKEAEKKRKALRSEKDDLNKFRRKFEAKLETLESREETIATLNEEISQRISELEENESVFKDKEIQFWNEKKDLRTRNEELEETKEKLLAERQRINEEIEQCNFIRGDTKIREQQLGSKEEFLRDAQRKLEEEDRDNTRDNINKQQVTNDERRKITEEYNKIEEAKKDLARRLNEYTEERKKTKQEDLRLLNEKARLQKEIRDFNEWKSVMEENNKTNTENLEKEYNYVADQLLVLDGNQKGLEAIRDDLEKYDKYLTEQHRLTLSQQKRFEILRRQFFEKLQTSHFDIDELRVYAVQFKSEFKNLQKEADTNIKLNREIEKGKMNIQFSVDQVTESLGKDRLDERKDENIRRKTTINKKEGSALMKEAKAIEDVYKLKQDADEIIEEMFKASILKVVQKDEEAKDAEIERLTKMIKDLEDNLDKERKEMKQAKLQHFLKQNTSKVLNVEHKVETKIEETKVEVRQEVNVHANDEEDQKAQQFANRGNTGRYSRTSMASMVTLKAPERLEELRDDVIVLCDASIDYIKEKAGDAADDPKHLKRIDYIEKSKRAVSNIFKVLNVLHNGKKEVNNKRLGVFVAEQEMFDHEMLKHKYEAKIKDLVDYIKRIRDNSEFFNPTADNDIVLN